MFDIGWSEILVIAVVAVIFVGPRELIPMLRTIGKQVGMLKRMAGDFQTQFNEALREAELDTIKKDVEQIGRIDPLRDIRSQVTKDLGEATRKLDQAAKPAGNATQAEVAKAMAPARAQEPASAPAVATDPADSNSIGQSEPKGPAEASS